MNLLFLLKSLDQQNLVKEILNRFYSLKPFLFDGKIIKGNDSLSFGISTCPIDDPEFTSLKVDQTRMISVSNETTKNIGIKNIISDNSQIGEIISIIDSLIIPKEAPQFTPITYELLVKAKEFLPKVFISLSSDNFVCITKDQGKNELDTIKEYKDKGVARFYFQKESSRLFLEQLKLKTFNKLLNPEVQASEKAINALALARVIGIEPMLLKSVDKVIEGLFKSNTKDRSIIEHLKKVKGGDKDYYETIKLELYVCSLLIKKSPALSSKSHLKKLALASFFKDIALPNNEHWSIDNINCAKFLELKPRERNDIYTHSIKGRAILEKSLLFDNDCLGIIQNHHERPDGLGFPRSLRVQKFSLLEKVFITSFRFGLIAIQNLNLLDNEKLFLKTVYERMDEEGFEARDIYPIYSILKKG